MGTGGRRSRLPQIVSAVTDSSYHGEMSSIIRYRMPEGAEIVSENGSTVIIHVTLPPDDDGHIGRQCPSCKRIFRMHVQDYSALPDDLRLTCPYCCAEEDHDEFMTGQQKERAIAAAEEYVQQLVSGTLDEMFSDLDSKVNSRRGAIRIGYSGDSRPSVRSQPLPPIIEEGLIRERQCAQCGNRYVVFGEHVACPACGPLPPWVVAEDALEAQEVALAALDQVPDAVLAQLREAGSLERSAAGALGSVVSILEKFLKQTFLDRVTGGDAIIARRGNVFQRLDDAAQLYRDHLSVDLQGAMGAAEWDRICLIYGIRHLATHTNGVVDQRHLDRFPGRGFVLGHRVLTTLTDARAAIQLARQLIAAIPLGGATFAS